MPRQHPLYSSCSLYKGQISLFIFLPCPSQKSLNPSKATVHHRSQPTSSPWSQQNCSPSASHRSLTSQVYSKYFVYLAPQSAQFLQRIWDICPWWWCLIGTSLFTSWRWPCSHPVLVILGTLPDTPPHVLFSCPLLPWDCWSLPPPPALKFSLWGGSQSPKQLQIHKQGPMNPKPCHQHQLYSQLLFFPVNVLLALFPPCDEAAFAKSSGRIVLGRLCWFPAIPGHCLVLVSKAWAHWYGNA